MVLLVEDVYLLVAMAVTPKFAALYILTYMLRSWFRSVYWASRFD
jgi:hypothetical protein